GFRAATLRCGRRVLDVASVGTFRSRFADASVPRRQQRPAPSQASAWSWSSTGLEEDDGGGGRGPLASLLRLLRRAEGQRRSDGQRRQLAHIPQYQGNDGNRCAHEREEITETNV